jgi:hypothetical protein
MRAAGRRAGRLLVVLLITAVVVGPARPSPAPGAVPLMCLDTALSHYADSGAGWTGGDSTWSSPLPGARELFAFSDTFLGPIAAPVRPPGRGIRAQFVRRA